MDNKMPCSAKALVADPMAHRHHCTCGGPHPTLETQIYVGKDAAVVLAGDLGRASGRGSVLVLDDTNTHAAAGRAVVTQLKAHQIAHLQLTLPGNTNATDAVADEVYRIGRDHDFILAVGAGTINDLAKFAAARQGRPYWVFPTAPSMNGYTSSIAAIKVDGVKRTLPAPPPRFVYVDPEVIASAPLDLLQSGYCDVLAKSVSDIDWQIESLLFSGSYCRLPSAMVAEAESAFLDSPEKLADAHTDIAMALLKGLLISGCAMSVAGSSAPASGGEHLFSHFLDMRESITGRQPELHGLQVAAGIVVSAACYRRLARLPASALEPRAEQRYQAEAKRIPTIWKSLSGEVGRRFSRKRNDLLALDGRLPETWPSIQSLCQQVPSPHYFANQIRRTGFKLAIHALNLDGAEFLLAATAARAIRERITVLDIAAQAGVLDAAARDALGCLR